MRKGVNTYRSENSQNHLSRTFQTQRANLSRIMTNVVYENGEVANFDPEAVGNPVSNTNQNERDLHFNPGGITYAAEIVNSSKRRV